MPTIRIRPAVPDDADTIVALIRELAAFENEPASTVRVTAEDIRRHGFGEQPGFEALVAETDAGVVGLVLYFRNFSTWEGRPGLYVEDLFVRPAARGLGVGRMLMAAVARRAGELGCRRVDLSVLHWNPARDFYRRIGMEHRSDWLSYRLTGSAIEALAAEAESP